MLPLKNWCDCLVDHTRTILIQIVWLQDLPLPPITEELDSFAEFSFQDEVQERSMTLLLCLIPVRFSKVSQRVIVCFFLELVKYPIIPVIESKQYALVDLLGFINALGALENNGMRDNHPLRVPFISANPVKFYIQDSNKFLPNFTEGPS